MCCIVLTSSQSVCVGSQGNSGVIKSQDQSFDALYGMYHSINLHVLSSGLIRGVNRQ
jgi:dihydroxyacetone kinase-like predicted kinase